MNIARVILLVAAGAALGVLSTKANGFVLALAVGAAVAGYAAGVVRGMKIK